MPSTGLSYVERVSVTLTGEDAPLRRAHPPLHKSIPRNSAQFQVLQMVPPQRTKRNGLEPISLSRCLCLRRSWQNYYRIGDNAPGSLRPEVSN